MFLLQKMKVRIGKCGVIGMILFDLRGLRKQYSKLSFIKVILLFANKHSNKLLSTAIGNIGSGDGRS